MTYLLALDQGTSSSRSIVFDERGHIVAQAQLELPQIDRLFTDAPPPEPFPALLQEAEVALTIVAAEQSS